MLIPTINAATAIAPIAIPPLAPAESESELLAVVVAERWLEGAAAALLTVDFDVDRSVELVSVLSDGFDEAVLSREMPSVVEKVCPSVCVETPEMVVPTISPTSTRGPRVTKGSLLQSQPTLGASQQNVVFVISLLHRGMIFPVSVLYGSLRYQISNATVGNQGRSGEQVPYLYCRIEGSLYLPSFGRCMFLC